MCATYSDLPSYKSMMSRRKVGGNQLCSLRFLSKYLLSKPYIYSLLHDENLAIFIENNCLDCEVYVRMYLYFIILYI